ncbi:type 2 lantibiotic [Limosilactobacillus gastricus]|uniref:mersacidin family lantibiotic n=1 Tax=Limosilactobacillus gastricus TaxID=227942 RepID=UPI000704D450|nr:hypothetical protein [Limosilactobacillus gastricus]QGF40969.1 type 2 lantibiotic [Limosilactobacillus gastricus]
MDANKKIDTVSGSPFESLSIEEMTKIQGSGSQNMMTVSPVATPIASFQASEYISHKINKFLHRN